MMNQLDLLTRTISNHLFLSQFEPLRALLITFKTLDPDIARQILLKIVLLGGRIPGALLSTGCHSPSHLAWLSFLELVNFDSIGVDFSVLRSKVDFLILVQETIDKYSNQDADIVILLSRVLDWGVNRLSSDVEAMVVEDEDWDRLGKCVVEYPEIFWAISVNLKRELEGGERDNGIKSLMKNVQLAHLDALKERLMEGDFSGAVSCVRFLNIDCGVDEDFYKKVLLELVNMALVGNAYYGANWEESRHKLLLIYTEALSSGCPKIVQIIQDKYTNLQINFVDLWIEKLKTTKLMVSVVEADADFRSMTIVGANDALVANLAKPEFRIQKVCERNQTTAARLKIAIQDQAFCEEIEHHSVSDAHYPLPVQKLLQALHSVNTSGIDDATHRSIIVQSCKKELYNYARISGIHILECVMNAALSAIRKEQIQEASAIASLFPLLQPLVAVLGWDLLSGKTAMRRKLMQLLWTSKSQELRLEEYSLYGKQTEEVSCVEYLCDLLCFRLDLAYFVACTNSGLSWNSKASLLFCQEEYNANEKEFENIDPFVENFVLERLAVQSPLRVLFDLVPGLKFQDAIELISLQPLNSASAAWKRMQDIELMHMRYALESTVLALGAMEKCSDGTNEYQFHLTVFYLKELQTHMEAISNAHRKIYIVSIITSILHMDDVPIDTVNTAPCRSRLAAIDLSRFNIYSKSGKQMVVSFTGMLLNILRHNLPSLGTEMEHLANSDAAGAARQAFEWRISHAKHFVEDWEWRLSILERLQPLSEHTWSWKEALIILRAAPSKLLNLCLQKAKYDLGEEAVHRFALPAEDKAALELAEWVASTFRSTSVEDIVSSVADGSTKSVQKIDFSSLRSQLGPLASLLLCIDVAATSARSVDTCKLLLEHARSMLSEIYPGTSPKIGSTYWDQIREVTIISASRRILQRMHDLLEQENAPTLQEMFSEMTVLSSYEPSKQSQRQRALTILHQIIDDAHKGKRQFLSGKLHNLSRALADEDADTTYRKGDGFICDDKVLLTREQGIVLGLGIKSAKPPPIPQVGTEHTSEITGPEQKDSKSIFGSIMSKSSTFLSTFIIYIATIGDIVDGIDTTHDFNFFSLIYEWPKDLLTSLVFERGSTDAAAKVADIMSVDFVHEVISACVPPVYSPRSRNGWACVPILPTLSKTSLENKISFSKGNLHNSFSSASGTPLYPLQLNIVRHLAKLSPVRAVLACVFGSSILSATEISASSSSNDALLQEPDAERLFYEFALDQSERFPTLNRWIQMQSNLHRVSEVAVSAKSNNEDASPKFEVKILVKRSRDPESDTESEADDIGISGNTSFPSSEFHTQGLHGFEPLQESPKLETAEVNTTTFLSFDWENEGPYENAVERLINEGKLMDALALSDRCLSSGASDQLLQLLIEQEEENNTISGHSNDRCNIASTSWQYCLRLKDKQLAARLALKYLHGWELNAAIDVLTMCSCHLPQGDLIRDEVLQMREALQRYNHIMKADDSYKSWQEVEAECKADPEGLALRLAGKGAVSAALEVAESASLSIDLRRELQGRQLVKLLTADPLNGGGPAEASRFLSSLRASDDALPVAIGAMQLLPDLRSKQLLVHFFLKRRVGNLSDAEVSRLNSWALGLRVLALLPLPSQQRCSGLHEHPHLIIEVLLMMKQLQTAALILKEFPSLRNNDTITTYASKAIAVNVTSAPREPRISISGSRPKQKTKTSSMMTRSNFTQSIGNLQREARRAFSWNRDSGGKSSPKDSHRKRKSSGLEASERVAWDAMTGIQEEHTVIADGQERLPFVPIVEEWVLTGNPTKDNAVRASHKYETSPDITLFKALLSLCSDELVSAKGSLELCISQMKNVLSSQHLPLNSSMEAMGRAYHATETFVQALSYAKSLLRKLTGTSDSSSNSGKNRDADEISDTGSSSVSSLCPDDVSEYLSQVDTWLGCAELLQSLLGSGIVASLDDIADKESSEKLRDRLIEEERYSMAIYTCKKCKIDAFPVWNAWGHALIRMERYVQARVKFKQALHLYKGDPPPVILEIINTLEGTPPVHVSSVRSMYEHLAKSAPTILDDSLSADSYLNVLYMPSTFPRSELSRQFHETRSREFITSNSEFDDGPRSNLDDIRYSECIHYLQEYARPQMLAFMFKHGRYADACLLFFPATGIPDTQQNASPNVPASSTQKADPLAMDFGSIDDLCDLCICYGAMPVLEDIISTKYASAASQDSTVIQYITSALVRICNFCETHRHFNYLYRFQVIRGDHIAAGLCCIQLFMNSSSQEEAVKHLENSKLHFEEGLSARHSMKLAPKSTRGKNASDKLTEEELVKFSARVGIQVEVVKSLNDADGPQWKHSLFGNPTDPETFRRRCEVAESLAEKHFDLAFQVIYQFNLPAVEIYASVAASLADRKKGGQLTEFLRNIKGTIDEDDWDQVLFAAINVYANKHKERPDRLIDMLISSHRKVLACVVCGRLKSAFQIASRSGSVADVQYVAHQAAHANALQVLDMCKQWVAQYM